jgi:purine-binding chemotaxis protein CheW
MKTPDATVAGAWCLIRINGRPLAVALHAVAEIVEAEELVRLPLCSPRILGLCTYRRDLVPVIDLSHPPDASESGLGFGSGSGSGLGPGSGSGSGSGPGSVEGRSVVLLLRSEHATWGIQIDRGGAIVAEGALDDRNTASAEAGGVILIGSIIRGDTAYAVIDAEATWRNVRDAVERWYKDDRGRDRDRDPGRGLQSAQEYQTRTYQP